MKSSSRGEAAFKSWEISYLKPMLGRMGGWDGPSEDPLVVQNRVAVLQMLAEAGDNDTITEARSRFTIFLKNHDAYSPAMKNAVLGIAGRNADEATYAALIKLGTSTTNPVEMQTYFTSAFSAKNPALAQKSLQNALSLPPQFAAFAPGIVAGVGQDNPRLAWDFFKANKTKLLSSLSTFEQTNAVTQIAQAFWNGVPESELESYVRASVPAEGAQLIAKSTESIKLSYQNRARMLPEIDAYLGAQRSALKGTEGSSQR